MEESLLKSLYKIFRTKQILVQLFIFCIISATTVFSAKAQGDTVTKYVVKKKSQTAMAGKGVTPYFIPPGGCSISGSGSIMGGANASYFLICSGDERADYWEVTLVR